MRFETTHGSLPAALALFVFSIFLFSGIASAQEFNITLPNLGANASWNAGSSGNTYRAAWNMSGAQNATLSTGGIVGLSLLGSNCTSNQSTWTLVNCGLCADIQHNFTLTCGSTYHLNNHNFTMIVNTTSNGGGNATNITFRNVSFVNVSVVVPTFSVADRTEDLQTRGDCIVAAMPWSVATIDSQGVQVGVRCFDNGKESMTCAVRDANAATCRWALSGYTCYDIAAVAASTSSAVAIEVCSQISGNGTLTVILGDSNQSRNTTLVQGIDFSSKPSRASIIPQLGQQIDIGGINLGSLGATAGKTNLVGGILLLGGACLIGYLFLTMRRGG